MREAGEIGQLVAAGLVPCIAYLGAGQWLLGRLGLAAAGLERAALAWLLGTGACSLAILLLRAFDVPVPLLATGALAALTWPLFRKRGVRPPHGADAGDGSAAASSQSPDAAVLPTWVRRVDAASGALAALTVLAALGPETFWDGFEYHLPLIAAWTEGPIRAVPGMLDAEFRAGVDLLYVPAVTSGFSDAAAVVTAGFALALAALVRAEATRRASPGAGALAAFFTLLAPLVVDLAPSSYVDLGVGAYGFGALLLADRWNRAGERPALFAAALCIGFALNAKLHAALLVPALGVLVLAGGRRPGPALLTACGALVAALALPWFVKTGLTSGNPFFPFLTDRFGTGPTDPRNLAWRRERIRANYPAPLNPLGLLQWLAALTFGRNPHVGGMLGPLPLALAPLALGRLSRASTLLALVVAALVVAQFFLLPAARFGTPVWPWLAVAAAVGGQRLAAAGRAPKLVLGITLALVAAHAVSVAAVAYLPRVAALRDPRAYEERIFPDQANLRRMVEHGEPVVAIPMGAVSWMPKPVYNLLWERNGEIYFLEGARPDGVLARLRERGVRSLVLDMEPPHPDDGRTGHPIADAWLADGRAVLARGVPILPARGERRFALLLLVDRPGAARP